MKAILLNVSSEDACRILNKKKSIIVDESPCLLKAIDKLIAEQGHAPCIIYCDEEGPFLHKATSVANGKVSYVLDREKDYMSWNNRAIAKFDASAEAICCEGLDNGCGGFNYFYSTESTDDIRKKSCLDEFELRDCLGVEQEGDVVGTAVYIHDLEIFKKPKELYDEDTFEELVRDAVRKRYEDASIGENHCPHLDEIERKCRDEAEANYIIAQAPESWCYINI